MNNQYVENVIWNLTSFMIQDEIYGFILLLDVYFACFDLFSHMRFLLDACFSVRFEGFQLLTSLRSNSSHFKI